MSATKAIKPKTIKKLVIECPECLIYSNVKDFNLENDLCNCCFTISQKYAYRYISQRGNIDANFYKTYLNEYADEKTKKTILKQLKKYPDEPVSIYTLHLKNKYRPSLYYDCLFFIETEGENLPIIVNNINTSSAMAMCMSCMCGDDDDDEPLTMEELLNLIPSGYRKSVKKIIEEGSH